MKDFIFKSSDYIVFAGDSVTDAGRKQPIGDGLWAGVGTGFVREVDNLINAFYPEREIGVVNMGTSGNSSRDLLNRFQGIIDLKPTHVVITIGFNDVWRFFDEPFVRRTQVKIDEYKENILKMIDMCDEIKASVILMTPYYLEPNKNDPMRKMMDDYRAVVKDIAKEKKLPCIDLQERFDKYMEKRYTSFITWDRVHPNHVGSTIIANEFLKFANFDFDRLK